MNEKLKPCPFCGAKACVFMILAAYYTDADLDYTDRDFRVACVYCGAGTVGHDLKEDAVNDWNRRVENA